MNKSEQTHIETRNTPHDLHSEAKKIFEKYKLTDLKFEVISPNLEIDQASTVDFLPGLKDLWLKIGDFFTPFDTKKVIRNTSTKTLSFGYARWYNKVKIDLKYNKERQQIRLRWKRVSHRNGGASPIALKKSFNISNIKDIPKYIRQTIQTQTKRENDTKDWINGSTLNNIENKANAMADLLKFIISN